ncbi:MAG: hypothetical protein KJO10_06500 [Gammaproteobacteria bacterium]|nr:hypothetical protein [Gammaproteobacteria bacterium]
MKTEPAQWVGMVRPHKSAGAGIAWLLVEGGFWLLSGPVTRLAGLYQSDFSLDTLPLPGLLGSWLAVGRHLRAIDDNRRSSRSCALPR